MNAFTDTYLVAGLRDKLFKKLQYTYFFVTLKKLQAKKSEIL